MTVTKRKSTPLSDLLATLPKAKRKSLLEDLIPRPGFNTADEILGEVFNITGAYQKLFTTVDKIEKIGGDLPEALRKTWTEHKEQAENDQVAFLAEMERSHKAFQQVADTKLEAIGKLARQAEKRGSTPHQKASLAYFFAGLGAGIVVMGTFYHLVILPKQIELARGGDGPVLDWLSSIDGRLMRRSFNSGNKSVKACLKKGGLNNSKKPICQIDLK